VGTALNGEEALAVAQRVNPDVITMDIHMPKVNGFDATRSIMETCPTPVVIVSGSSSIDEVATNFRAIERVRWPLWLDRVDSVIPSTNPQPRNWWKRSADVRS